MHREAPFLFILLLGIFIDQSVSQNPITFNNFKVSWTHLKDTSEIEFNVEVKATGWVGFGISLKNTAMDDIDLFVGGVQNSGGYLKDYYSTTQGTPTLDSQQDFTLISATESNGVTSLRCKRKLVTNDKDAKDLDITAGKKVYLAWAYHDSEDVPSNFGYHSERGYSQQMVDLLAAALSPPSPSPSPSPSLSSSPSAAPLPSPSTSPSPSPSYSISLLSSSSYSSSPSSSLSLTSSVTMTTTSIPVSNKLDFSKGKFQVSWEFDPSKKDLLFKVVAIGTGWVGLGISKFERDMKDLDIAVLSVSNGQTHVEDYYSTSPTKPNRDKVQNWEVIDGTEESGVTTVQFKRNIETGDSKDLQIVPGMSYYLAWAMSSSSDTFGYHGASKGYSNNKVVLVPGTAPTATPTAPPTTTTSPPTGSIKFQDGKGSITWNYDKIKKEIIFIVIAPATGWVAMGISKENHDMRALDVVVGYVEDSVVSVEDFSVSKTTTPTRDAKQDYQRLSGNQDNNVTTIKFKRKLNTGDSNDIVIEENVKYYLAWAYHVTSDDTRNHFIKHSSRGYTGQVVLAVNASASMTSCTVAMVIFAVFAVIITQ